jgi:hypothetical protein
MSTTIDHKISTDVNAIDEIAAIPTVNDSTKPVPVSYQEDIKEIKKAVRTVLGIVAGLFVLTLLFSHKSSAPAPAATAAPAAAAPAAATTAGAPVVINLPASHSVSFPRNLTAHHLGGQEYSLTWQSMGDGYTYRIYYSNDKQMRDASEAFFRPVDGTLYRFTMNGDAKNVWMAVAPVGANQEEGLMSHPVNIGHAREG